MADNSDETRYFSSFPLVSPDGWLGLEADHGDQPVTTLAHIVVNLPAHRLPLSPVGVLFLLPAHRDLLPGWFGLTIGNG